MMRLDYSWKSRVLCPGTSLGKSWSVRRTGTRGLWEVSHSPWQRMWRGLSRLCVQLPETRWVPTCCLHPRPLEQEWGWADDGSGPSSPVLHNRRRISGRIQGVSSLSGGF